MAHKKDLEHHLCRRFNPADKKTQAMDHAHRLRVIECVSGLRVDDVGLRRR